MLENGFKKCTFPFFDLSVFCNFSEEGKNRFSSNHKTPSSFVLNFWPPFWPNLNFSLTLFIFCQKCIVWWLAYFPIFVFQDRFWGHNNGWLAVIIILAGKRIKLTCLQHCLGGQLDCCVSECKFWAHQLLRGQVADKIQQIWQTWKA